MWIVKIIADLLAPLLTWLGKRKDGSALEKATESQAKAEAASAPIRETGANAVETAREVNEQAIARGNADAAGPGGLRKQSTDVQSALDAADSGLR